MILYYRFLFILVELSTVYSSIPVILVEQMHLYMYLYL